MADEKEIIEEVKEGAPPKKSSLNFIILGVVVLLLGAGGFFGLNLYKKMESEKPGTAEVKKKKKRKESLIVYPLDSFIVNLLDRSGVGRRYLKVEIQLEVDGEERQKMLVVHSPQLRDTILLLLSSQTFSDINSMEGKLELKQALLSRINQVLGGKVVNRLYFTEFVVQ